MELALTFDDVQLVPQFNNISSRTDPTMSLSSSLTKDIKIQIPLVPANMDSVIGPELAEIIVANGGMPIFHRFIKVSEQIEWVKRFGNKTFVSCGVNESPELFSILDQGPAGVCIDVAHGHSDMMYRMIALIKKRYPGLQIIAGNVCTAMGYQDLATREVDAVKVGVGPGAACTTRIVTGFGIPQFSAIQDCAQIAKKLKIPIIADGGIRRSDDVVIALAAGASTVMIGKLFSLTEESASQKRGTSPRQAKYRGQASKDFQDEFYGGLKEKTVAEGTDFWAPTSGSAQDLINNLLGGIRTGLTYGGARSIKELQTKAEFRRVTPNSFAENNPRRD